MHYKLNDVPFLIIIFSLAIVIEQSCQAQGYAPMAPAAPTSSDFTRPVVPGPPMQPSSASRPASWPRQAAVEASPWIPPDQRSAAVPLAEPVPPAVGELKPCNGTRIIARVGDEAIFESEAAGAVNEIIEANKDRIPANQLEKQREMLIQQRLKGLIETKLIYLDARSTIPAEGLPQVKKQIAAYFDEHEVERLIEKTEVQTAHELDLKLRKLGTSLDQEKRAFIERSLAQQWVQQKIKRDEEITGDQLDVVAYYQEHLDEFTSPARAEWEELMVHYSKYPTKVAAFEAIARMGNKVCGGVSFAQVAKTESDGLTAAEGGRWPWTSKNALTCRQIDEALFNLPVGQLSPIIAGEKGYHILRVIRREVETVLPYLEAQVEIKKKIVEKRSKKQFRDYMAELRRKTPIWTIFDGNDGTLQLANPQQPIRR